MMYWTDGSWGWGGWIAMVLSMALFWGLLVWVAVAFARAAPGGDGSQPPRATTAEDLLASRFARGEIDDGEYRSRSEAIRRERSKAEQPGTKQNP